MFVLFFNLVFCLERIRGVFPSDDRFNFTMRSSTGNDEQAVSSVTQVLASLANQFTTGGLNGINGSYTAEVQYLLKNAGAYVAIWLEGLDLNVKADLAINATTENIISNELPVYGKCERSKCDYYLESCIFFYLICICIKALWAAIVFILNLNSYYLYHLIK